MNYVLLNSCNLSWGNLAQKCWNNQSKGRFSNENQNAVGLFEGRKYDWRGDVQQFSGACSGGMKFILL